MHSGVLASDESHSRDSIALSIRYGQHLRAE